MKNKYHLSFLVSTFLLLFSAFCEEKLFFQLDGKDWKIGSMHHESDLSSIEMVVDDESPASWTELFTIHKYKDLKDVSVTDFLKTLEEAYKEKKIAAINEKIKFQWDSKDPSNLIESSFKPTEEKELQINEFNIARVLKSDDNLYYLQYSAKDPKQFEQNKSKWTALLKSASSGETQSEENPSGHWFTLNNDEIFEGPNKLAFNPDQTTIEDKEAGFRIVLPSNWLVSQDWIKSENLEKKLSGAIALLFRRPDEVVYGGVSFVNFDEKESLPKENLLETIRTFFQKQFLEQNPKTKIISEGEIETTSGDQGKYIVFEDENDIAWFTFFSDDNKFYRLEIWCPKEQFENVEKDFETLLTGFHVL